MYLYFFFSASLVFTINKVYKSVHKRLEGTQWNELCWFLWFPIYSNRKVLPPLGFCCETTEAVCEWHWSPRGSKGLSFVVIKRILVKVSAQFGTFRVITCRKQTEKLQGYTFMHWAHEIVYKAVELKTLTTNLMKLSFCARYQGK